MRWTKILLSLVMIVPVIFSGQRRRRPPRGKKVRRGFPRPETVNAEPELLDYLNRLDAYDPDAWEQAMKAKGTVEPYAFDELSSAPLELPRHGAFIADGDGNGKVRPAKNPAEHASFGFAGPAIKLRLDGEYVPGTLFLPLDEEATKEVEVTSIALFRWDDARQGFEQVVPSGASVLPDRERDDLWHTYVWGRVTLPGIYVPVGIPKNPAVQRTLAAFLAGRDLFDQLDGDSLRGFQDRICGLILCAPDFDRFGGGWGNLCERCLGLDLSIGLPELELIHPKRPGGGFEFSPCVPSCRYGEWQSAGPTIWHESPTVDLAGCSFDLALDTSGGTSRYLYTASANGGIWRRALPVTTSSGWTPLTDDEISLITTAVSVAPSNGNVVYYVDGLGYVLRSDDHGRTWGRTSGTIFSGVRRILIDPTDPMKVYVAASGQGFYASTNGGATWRLRLVGGILDAALDPGNSAVIYAGERFVGIYKSYDMGVTWDLILPWATPNVNPGGSSMIKIALGRLGTDANRTVAVKFGEAILVNDNGGRPPGTPGGGPWNIRGQPGNPGAGNGQGDWSHCIAVDPFDNRVMLAGGHTLWRTSDGGQTWRFVAGFYNPHEDEHAVIFDPTRQNVAYMASDGGVAQSLDGGATWTHINNGLETAQLYTCGIANRKAVGNVYHSGFTGTHDATTRVWENLEGHSWEFRNIAGDGKTSWYFYIVGGGDLLRREFPARTGIPALQTIAIFDSFCVAGDPRTTSNVLLVGSTGTIQRAMDGFTQPPIAFSPETLANVAATDQIVTIVFAPSRPGMAYALASNGKVWRKADVASTTSWEFRGQWQPGARSLAVNPLNPDRVYVLSPDSIALSADGGTTWNSIPGTGTASLPQTGDYRSIVAYPYAPQILFAASRFGVFVTFDEGAHWRTFDHGLPNAEITEMEWSGSALYTVLHGRGLWRREWCP
jgi:photosystem II stability/assembly factor-like uncharacterized protein